MAKKYFILNLEVKYRDTDSMGHVSSPVYYEYIQHAYVKYMHTLLAIPFSEKLPQIMVKTSCEYIAPAVLCDRLRVTCSVTDFGNKSFGMQYDIYQENKDERKLIAKGTSKHVCFDYHFNKSVPVPEEMKTRVLNFQGAL